MNSTPGQLRLRVRGAIRWTAQRVAPRLYLRLLAHYMGYQEPEVALLADLCEPTRSCIDVGASSGRYFVHMLQHSPYCYAFEARAESAAELRSRLGPRVSAEVVAKAVSDHAGTARLRVPDSDTGRSTIESANALEELQEVHTVDVDLVRLDDFPFAAPLGFVKIDIEGHEVAALSGGRDRIASDEPALLIEIEERHNPGSMTRVRELLEPLGYRGFYLLDGRLHRLDEFDPDTQVRVSEARGKDVNNFLFLTTRLQSHVAHFGVEPTAWLEPPDRSARKAAEDSSSVDQSSR